MPFGYDHKYTYSHLGYNLKITDMQAACGLAQLDRLEGFIKKRRENFNFLYKNLKELEEFLILPEPEKNSDPSWFGFAISLRYNNKYNRNDLVKYLNENKIGTRLLFSGNLTKQPYMKDLLFRVSGELKNTDFIMENTFWIGLYPGLSLKHLDYVINKFKGYFKK
jgi:CDP-6-deoxy-D-xylo-4-hexulose-3-dehydrase